eukprot:scaffold5570_cov69-Phaeocystis_antarctica.AAC.1
MHSNILLARVALFSSCQAPHALTLQQSRGGASAHREGEGRRLEHRSARRAVVCIGLRCLGQERLARPTVRTCGQLAHGRWAGDRVGRSAR